MSHVFISYSRDDTAYAQRLATYLTQHDIPVWWDAKLAVGDAVTSTIQTAIDEAYAFVPVLTPAAVASRWVLREIDYADRLGRPMLPVLLANCIPPITLAGIRHEEVTSGRMPTDRFTDRIRDLTCRPAQTEHIAYVPSLPWAGQSVPPAHHRSAPRSDDPIG